MGATNHAQIIGLPSGELTLCYGNIHHVSWENPLFLWPCSIAMLIYVNDGHRISINYFNLDIDSDSNHKSFINSEIVDLWLLSDRRCRDLHSNSPGLHAHVWKKFGHSLRRPGRHGRHTNKVGRGAMASHGHGVFSELTGNFYGIKYMTYKWG